MGRSPKTVAATSPKNGPKYAPGSPVLAQCEPLESRTLLAGTPAPSRFAVLYSVSDGRSTNAAAVPTDRIDIALDRKLRQQGLGGPGGLLRSLPSQPRLTRPADSSAALRPRGIFGTDDRIRVDNTTAFPYSPVGEVRFTFPDQSQFTGTGVLIDAFHVLTCGHCVYSANDGGWATSFDFSPGNNGADAPFGTASATLIRTYSEWVQNADPGNDWALVTLDRNIGNYTGWFGYEATNDDTAYTGRPVTSAGYPGDQSFGTMWRESGSLLNADATELYFNNTLDVMPGQSGSPLWRTSPAGDGPFINGLIAYSGPDYNWGTRLTTGKFASIRQWIAEDTAPTDRPDLADFASVRGTARSAINTNTASPGDTVTIAAGLFNAGTAAAGAFSVEFSLSTDPTRTDDDIFLGLSPVSGLAALGSADVSLTAKLPTTLPPGTYSVEWHLDAKNQVTEASELNNAGTITGETLTIARRTPTIATFAASIATSPAGVMTARLSALGVVTATTGGNHVRFFRESNGKPGLQTGTGGDVFIADDFSAPYTAGPSKALIAGGSYTYYARAIDGQGALGTVVTATLNIPLPVGTTISLDNASASGISVLGPWASANAIAGFVGSDYLSADGSARGARQVRYTPTLPAAGNYNVYARWVGASTSSSKTAYDIQSAGLSVTVLKDQRTGGGVWQLLGTYNFVAGLAGSVTVRNAGTSGLVVADAVKFVYAG